MLTTESRPSRTSPVRSNWQSGLMKARFNDHVITVRDVPLPNGRTLPEGTHGFVIEAFADPGYPVGLLQAGSEEECLRGTRRTDRDRY
jgi:hypothetical protein